MGRAYVAGVGMTAFAKPGSRDWTYPEMVAQAAGDALEDVLGSRMIHDPLTKLQCSPTSDGAAAAVVVSARFVDEHDLRGQAVEIAGMAMVTDTPATFETRSDISLVGADMSRRAAQQVYEATGLGAEDVQVVELHDCFSANEVLTCEALGLCAEGKGGVLAMDGARTYGGQWVVNPSGGLISKGHPLGATGIARARSTRGSCAGWPARPAPPRPRPAPPRPAPPQPIMRAHVIGCGGSMPGKRCGSATPDQGVRAQRQLWRQRARQDARRRHNRSTGAPHKVSCGAAVRPALRRPR